ncbi:complement C3-like [Prionailurus iriomotensis]
MKQASVMISKSLVYPPQAGQQSIIIRASWAPISDSSFTEEIVLGAPHAGYICPDRQDYLHPFQYRVFAANHKMNPVTRTFTLDIKVASPDGKNPEGITVISQNLRAKEGFFAISPPRDRHLGTWSIEASYQSAAKQQFKAAVDIRDDVGYIFNKPVDGHALAIFGVKLDSRRMPIQSSLQRVEGGEMVQVETSGVKIVRSPYNIKFTRTPPSISSQGCPSALGETHEPLQPEEQASARVTAWPYLTQDGSRNFLYIEVLSKGQIVYAKHQLKSHGSVYTSAIIDVTSETLTSFCILAFYLLPRAKGQDPELVADSIWIDVNDRCMGTLKVGLKNEGPFQPLEPNRQVEVKVIGGAEATVRLVAMDKAVYVLNSKHKPTQKKVWDVVEEHDIGCTAGSGKDRLAVFNNAGLDLRMSRGIDALARSG